MEILMEFLIGIIFETYIGIGEILVPEYKSKKWRETLLKIVCLSVSLLILACIGAGICLLFDASMKTLGIIFLSTGCALLALQIILYVIVIVNKAKKENRERKGD